MADDNVSSVHPPTPGTYRVDPSRSTISYSGRHMFGLGKVHATFALESGTLQVTEGLAGSTADITVDAASFSSGNAKRDRDVRSATLLDVERYPTIRFVSDGLGERDREWRLPGIVTAHGTSVPVEAVVDRLDQDGDDLRIVAHARHLDRYAFGVVKGKGMVGRYLDLDLEVVAVPA